MSRTLLPRSTVLFFFLFFLAAIGSAHAWSTPVEACREPAGPLDLEARLLEVVPRPSSPEMTAVARVELVLRAAVPARDIVLDLEKPAGGPGPLHTVPSLARGEAARTILEIPVRGKALHEIVIRAMAAGATGPIATEVLVRVPLGVPVPEPVDDGTVAEFPAVGSEEARSEGGR